MIWWVMGAMAGELDDIRSLEWRRASASSLEPQLDSADPAVRRLAAVALGRLRDPSAGAALAGAAGDPASVVRLAAIEGLGYSDGAAWLAELWAQVSPEGNDELRAAIVRALGHAATAEQLDLLCAALGERGGIAVAAGHALGRMAIRKVEGVAGSRPYLVAALRRPEPNIVEAAAWALRRLTLGEEPAPAVISSLLHVAKSGPTAGARAHAVQTVLAHLDDERRQALVSSALTAASPEIRVAALRAAKDVAPEGIAAQLDHFHPWVDAEAVALLGRIGAESILRERLEFAGDPWAAAALWSAIVEAGGTFDPGLVSSEVVPVPVRAELASKLVDPAALLDLVREADEVTIRTGAALALLGLEEPPPGTAERLLESPDAVLREAGMELLRAERLDSTVVEIVISALAEEDSAAVRLLGLALLVEASDQEDLVVEGLPELASRFTNDPDLAVRRAAARLAGEAGAPATPQLRTPPDIVALGVRVMTDRGEFRIALNEEVAPYAVANFVSLAAADFFDGRVFHRVVPAFVVQTGCPRDDGWGGPGYTIPDEVSSVPYGVGAVGMARGGRDTGGSQWFVTLTPQPHLVGEYTLFGQVTSGMEVVSHLRRGDKIVDVVIEN